MPNRIISIDLDLPPPPDLSGVESAVQALTLALHILPDFARRNFQLELRFGEDLTGIAPGMPPTSRVRCGWRGEYIERTDIFADPWPVVASSS